MAADSTEIIVTPEMIHAGRLALVPTDPDEPPAFIVNRVYRAMAALAPVRYVRRKKEPSEPKPWRPRVRK